MRVLRISHSAVVGEWRNRERAIRSRGIAVRLLSARRWNEGGRVVPLEPEPGEDVVGVATLGTHPNLFCYDPRPLWRALGEAWDVIDIHEEPFSVATAEVLALRALRRLRAPYVLYSAQNLAKRYPPPFRWWERRALRGAAAVSVCNTEAGRILRTKGLTAPAQLIGLGVDTDRFAPSDAGSSDDENGPVSVGYVGRLAAHKGVDVLLEAIARDGRLVLDLAGAGPQEDELRRRAEEPDLAGRVFFHGHLTQAELPDFYRSLDVLAVPSVPTPGWLEQFCRVAVEAMASGVLVVASDTGALPDVVGDSGILVPPGDPTALAASLGIVRDDRTRAAELRQRGIAQAATFSWDRVGAQYVDLYHQLAPGAIAGSAPVRGAEPEPGPDVIVVAYGAPDLLDRCLATLGAAFPVIVVDNSSDEAVRRIVVAAGAEYVDPGANLGFGSAVNLALARRHRSEADVLLLNPDAAIDPAGVRVLQRRLHREPDLAAVSPAQVDDTGSAAQVLWPFPSPAGAWLQAVGLGRWHRAEQFAIGSVLLLRSAALAEVGGFDDDFFLYCEETDWQYRAHLASWRTALEPSVLATHIGGATSTDPARRETHFHASQERYLRKYFGSRGWASARTAVLIGSAVRAVLLLGERGAAARLRVHLYRQGPLRAEAKLPGFDRNSAAAHPSAGAA